MASLTVLAFVAEIRISCMSGVPGPACTPPPKIFPSGIGNLYSLCSEINLKSGFPIAFDAHSIAAIETA